MSQLRDIVNTPRPRKRPREDESPTFTDFSPIGIEDLEVLTKLEARFAQNSSPLAKKRKPSPSDRFGSSPAKELSSKKTSHGNATPAPTLGITPTNGATEILFPTKLPLPSKPAVSTTASNQGKSKQVPPDDYDDAFDDLDDPLPFPENDFSFFFAPATGSIPTTVSFVRPSKDLGKGPMKVIRPSAAALQAAQKLMAEVEADEEKEKARTEASSATASSSASSQIQNHRLTPLIPPKASQRIQPEVSTSRDLNFAPAPSKSIKTPVSSNSVIPSNSEHQSVALTTGALSLPPTKLNTTPSRPTTLTETPSSIPKHLGMRSRPRGPARSKFATPWKKDGDPAALNIETPSKPGRSETLPKPKPIFTIPVSSHSRNSLKGETGEQAKMGEGKKSSRFEPLSYSVFDINPLTDRKRLKDLGMPNKRSLKTAVKFGIPEAVGDIEPWNALYWVFDSDDNKKQDVNTAFVEMRKAGCSLVKKEWVENHWVLIIWKLANMVLVWSESQSERWSFQEVLNQLLYRYEREINRSHRPPVRLIQERDASANSAMVLCVFDIVWPPGEVKEQSRPELVLTDGWYKIRAKIDASLSKAVSRRKVRVGTKLEIIGARLDAQRKDPDDVLKSFNSSCIIISGNGSHLARWDTKLGWRATPSIATLSSLTKDGGVVHLLLVTIQHAFSIRYRLPTGEILEAEEEMAARDEWQKKRALEENRLRDEACKELEKLEDLIERLENIAGAAMARIHASDDAAPDEADSYADDLEESDDPKTTLKGLSPTLAAWTAQSLRDRYRRRQETLAVDIQSELENSFPPRVVNAFRILVITDASIQARRECQLTVWNAEETRDLLMTGKNYMVTNLMPHMPSCWVDDERGHQIFLCTKKDTRWKSITLPKCTSPA